MSSEKTWVTSGLIFLSARDIDIVETGNRISATLEGLRQRVTRVRILNEATAQIHTTHHEVLLSLHCDHKIAGLAVPANVILAIKMTNRNAQDATDKINRDTLLAHLLRALHKKLHADFVKWIGRDALFKGSAFLEATSPLDKPGRMLSTPLKTEKQAPKKRDPHALGKQALSLPEIEQSSELLDQKLLALPAWANAPSDQEAVRAAMRATDETGLQKAETDAEADQPKADPHDIREETPLLRLSAWLLSIAVAILCLPVGCALFVINLLRGENLRLASQASALTGTFVALQTTGATAQAATVIQAVIN